MNNNKILNNSTLPVPVLSPGFVTGLADGEGSSPSLSPSLNSYYITGFSYAESSFSIQFNKNKNGT